MYRTPWLSNRRHRWVAVALLGPLLFLLPGSLPNDWWDNGLRPEAIAPAPAVALEEATPDATVSATFSNSQAQRVEHLAQLGVPRWHAAGYRGRGVTVAILDSGFRGYREHRGHALPAHLTVRSFRKDGNLEAKDSQHGILCGEVIHALAPEAELLFANWDPDSPEQFLTAVRWARQQGARILSCSLIMPSWSDGEGGGPVHETLARILGTGGDRNDLLCFACAGNTAQRHWSGPFQDDGTGFHAWQRGQIDNRLLPWGEERVSVELCCPVGAGYDLFVLDQATGAEVGRSSVRGRTAASCTVVRFTPQAGHTYAVRVRLAEGTARPFHLVALGGSLGCATARSSITFPGDGSEVIAVGAVDHDGHRTGYSSCGPNSPQPKPDLVAAVPFPSLWRSRAFSGTSAAAPQAAALAALWWSRYPEWTANHVWAALRGSARDLGPPGHDYETGYGLITLP
jgi:subtilisin family serine protease